MVRLADEKKSAQRHGFEVFEAAYAMFRPEGAGAWEPAVCRLR